MMKRMGLMALLIVASMGLGRASSAEQTNHGFIVNTESATDKQIRMQWWKEARFGMFVHWGLYSSAEGEWDGKTFDRGAPLV